MPKRAPYFHVYIGLMVVFASYAMGGTMRVREARLRQSQQRCQPVPCPQIETKAFSTSSVGNEKREVPTSGVCSVQIIVCQSPIPRVEKPTLNTCHGGNVSFFIVDTNGFLLENGKVLIHCDGDLISHVSETEDWKVSLTARFPGRKFDIPLKIEKYSIPTCMAICTFTPPDTFGSAIPLQNGTAPMPERDSPIQFVCCVENWNDREKSFDEPVPVIVSAKAGGVYQPEERPKIPSRFWSSRKHPERVPLGALVLDERNRVVGVFSIEPPQPCGWRDSFVMPLATVLESMEEMKSPDSNL